MFKFIWPALILLGILFVMLFDVGNGLASPGFWFIPIGVIGGLVTVLRKPKNRQAPPGNSHTALNACLILIWLVAAFCIGGLYFGWFTDGYGTFLYIWPAILFTLTGIILLVIRIFKR